MTTTQRSMRKGSDVLTYHSDPAHGWLAVPLAEYPDARTFGTGFGYIDRASGVVYLETDYEAPAFLAAHPDATFATIVYDDFCSAIRSLPRIPDAKG